MTEVRKALFPRGEPRRPQTAELLDLYKIMVTSSENLVARRQGLNTYFLTVNGAVVSAAGFVLAASIGEQARSTALAALTLVGAVLSIAWWMLLVSFGQLNTGKFKVINTLEEYLPAAVYSAEWEALGRGEDPKLYRSFTKREIWVPRVFVIVYAIALAVQIAIFFGLSGWLAGLNLGLDMPIPSSSTSP